MIIQIQKLMLDYYLSAALFSLSELIFCQTAQIKGRLIDSSTNIILQNAVISILGQSDSTLVTKSAKQHFLIFFSLLNFTVI